MLHNHTQSILIFDQNKFHSTIWSNTLQAELKMVPMLALQVDQVQDPDPTLTSMYPLCTPAPHGHQCHPLHPLPLSHADDGISRPRPCHTPPPNSEPLLGPACPGGSPHFPELNATLPYPRTPLQNSERVASARHDHATVGMDDHLCTRRHPCPPRHRDHAPTSASA